MVKVITQQTFNEAVTELMDLFEMSPNEALKEAIVQFETQGVNLANIIKRVPVDGDCPMEMVIKDLKNNSSEGEVKDMSKAIELIEKLSKLLSEDLAYRLLAAKLEAYPLLMDIIEQSSVSKDVSIKCMNSLIILMDGYPDLLDSRGVTYIMTHLKQKCEDDLATSIFQWVHKCCLKHEKNRQRFIEEGIIAMIAMYLTPDAKPRLIKALSSVVCALTLDDDVREVISESHKHAVALARELLKPMLVVLEGYANDPVVLRNLYHGLIPLMVRSELCELFETEGGMNLLLEAFARFSEDKKLNLRIVQLMAKLAGSDLVRRKLVDQGAASLIALSLNTHQKSSEFCSAAFHTIAALTLRDSKNSNEFLKVCCIDSVLDIMKKYPAHKTLQSSGLRAFRNLSSHNPEVREYILSIGVEEVIYEILDQHPDCKEIAKQVLRELGCNVVLNEPWTGKEGDKLKGN